MRYAFQVAYDGTRYFGFARQPGLRTVEGELLRTLEECELYDELTNARYQVASRTDRSVSAICQVIALDVLKRPNLRALNARLPPDIAFLAAARVDPFFDSRWHALRKRYRYICERPRGFDLTKAKRAAKLFVGRHDFRNFCKPERGRPTIAELERASIQGGRVLTFDFVAKTFLWQQVRRLVNALLAVGAEELKIEELRQMLEGQINRPIAPAPPEGLILMGIEYENLRFKPDPTLAPQFMGYIEFGRAFHARRAMVLEHIARALL